jgi:hypothetical protein
MNFPPSRVTVYAAQDSIQDLNSLDTVSPIVVWLSDHKNGGASPMLSRSVSTCSSHDIRRTPASRLLLATFTLLLFSVPALAQSTAGRILGTVTDQSGAAVSGATVVVNDVQRGVSRTLATDDSGEYVAADLQPGTYKIRVEFKGFKTAERPNVVIEVATDVRADFSMQTGQVSETVVVSEEIPLVNTMSSTLGGTLSNEEINDLPLQWPQLRESSAVASWRDALSRWRVFHHQRQRAARRRQRVFR